MVTRYLLDTQPFLWSCLKSNRLKQSVIMDFLENSQCEIYVSAASVWEISIKWAKGTLQLPAAPKIYLPQKFIETNTKPLAVSHLHTLVVTDLPKHHGDPFDRLLIGQAICENMTILTNDPYFAAYSVSHINVEEYERSSN